MRRLPSTALAMLLPITIAGCSKSVPESPAAQPRAVLVAPVALRPLASDSMVSGRLVPREEAVVASQLSGYQVVAVLVDQGDMVRAGQVLARLDDSLLRADIAEQQANLVQKEVAAKKAEQDAGRVAGLDDSGVLSDEAIEGRRMAARSARAAVAQAQALLDAQRVRARLMEVRAPVSGRILERSVRPGDVSSPSTPMFRIARGDLIELDAEVPERMIGLIRPGQTADVVLPTATRISGTIRLVSPEVNRDTNLGRARILLPPRPDLRPGGFAQAILGQAQAPLVSSVPTAAVQYGASGATVMTLGKGNTVTTRTVKTGRSGGGYIELVDGPPPGTRVLLGSQGFLLDGDKVTPRLAGTAQ